MTEITDIMYISRIWKAVELEEEMVLMPEVSHEEDIKLPEGGFLRNIMVTVKLLPDND